jgi:hypothetical protein
MCAYVLRRNLLLTGDKTLCILNPVIGVVIFGTEYLLCWSFIPL